MQTIDEPLQLYQIGPDYANLPYDDPNEIIPRTVVIDPKLVNRWLEHVKGLKYPSYPRKLAKYTIDYPGLMPINDKTMEIKVYETIVKVPLRNVEDICSDLVEIHECDSMGSVRGIRLFKHNLILLPDTGSNIIKQLQPYLEIGKKAQQEFEDRLNSIDHPNVIISQ